MPSDTIKGIVLAGGTGSRLDPLTRSISKQLLPVYDKPMIYYPLSVLMLAGIREILVIYGPRDREAFHRVLANGRQWGIDIEYAIQPQPGGIAQALLIAESFLGGARCALVLGDNLFFGQDFVPRLKRASARQTGATVFAHEVANSSEYGVIEFDSTEQPISIVEKPRIPKSQWAITGLYFYDNQAVSVAKTLTPSPRGELEISDVNRAYLEQNQICVERLTRGFTWLDMGTPASLLQAGNLVQAIEGRSGHLIASLKEIAILNRWIR